MKTALHDAAKNNEIEKIKKLVKGGFFTKAIAVDEQDEKGDTALHIAAREGHVAAVRCLMEECKAKVGIKNNRKQTAHDIAKNIEIENLFPTLFVRRRYFDTLEGKKILDQLHQNDPTLTSLDLALKALDIKDMKFLVKGLENNHTLTSLHLWHNNLGIEGATFLVEGLKNNQTLTGLNLFNNHFDVEEMNFLVEALKTHKLLFDIYLDSNLETTEFKALMARNKQLKAQLHSAVQRGDVDLVRQLVQEGVSLLSVSGDEINTPLHWAILKNNIEVAAYLIAEMKKRGNPLDVRNKAKKTAAELAQNNYKLKALFTTSTSVLSNANDNPTTIRYFKTKEGKAILRRLQQNDPTLISLILHEKNLGVEEMKILAAGLKVNHTLTFLDLSYNNIDIEGVKFLVEGLKDNCTLVWLELRNNKLDMEEGEKVFVEALQTNKSLLTISLTFFFEYVYRSAYKKTTEFETLLARNQTLKDQLHEAVQQGDRRLVRQLVQEGVSLLSISGDEQNTPLHWAILKGHVEVAAYLIAEMEKRGNPLDVRNKAKKTAEELAQGNNLKLETISLLGKAKEHVSKQQWHKALSYYEQLLQQNENLIVAWLGKADVLLQQKEYTKAESCFDAVLLLDDNNAESSFGQGLILAAEGQLDHALSYFNKTLELQPDLYKARCEKAIVLLQKGQIAEALICYDEFLKINAKHQNALQQKIFILCHQKQYSEALTHINLALQHYPSDGFFSNSPGYVLLQQKKAKEILNAEILFNRNIKQTNSLSSFALQGKGFVELERKRKGPAEHYFTQAEQAANNNEELLTLFFQRAQIYQAWNMPAEAKACYEKILQYEVNHSFAKLYLSQLTKNTAISVSNDSDNNNDAPASPPLLKPLGKLEISFVIPYSQLTLEKQIKKNSFCMVYQGIWQTSPVAVKQLLREDALIKFQNEMEVMAKLRHPHIVQLYGVVTDHLPYCMVMEYLSGGSLYDFLHSHSSISWGQREQIALDIAKGLHYLHEEEVLHCDLTSLNVLLDESQRAKLCDFGLAKMKYETASITCSNSSNTSALAWMAPELFQGEKCSKASDMYSYGMVLWEIVTRDIPFKNLTSPQLIMFQVLQREEPEVITEECKIESLKLAHLIKGCWNKTSSERPIAERAVKILQGKENINSLESDDFISNLASINNNYVNASTTTFDSLDNLHSLGLGKNG